MFHHHWSRRYFSLLSLLAIWGLFCHVFFFQPFLVCKYTGFVELTWKTACLKSQEDCDLAWWYLRTTPFWYRLGCLKPGLGWILHICCCLLRCAMDSFYGTWGIKGGNQWVQWVSKGANFSFISEQSISSIKFLLAGMESLADFMNEPFDLFTLIVLTWAVWKISFTLGPRVSHEARPVGQFGHHSFTNFEHHFLMASCQLAARTLLKMVRGFTPCAVLGNQIESHFRCRWPHILGLIAQLENSAVWAAFLC